MNRRLKKFLPMERRIVKNLTVKKNLVIKKAQTVMQILEGRMVLTARRNRIAGIIPPFVKTPIVRLILKVIMTLVMNRSQKARTMERKTIF